MAETDSVCPIGKSVQSNGDVSADMLIWNSVFQLIDDHDGERTGNLDPSAQTNRELDLQILEWVADPLH